MPEEYREWSRAIDMVQGEMSAAAKVQPTIAMPATVASIPVQGNEPQIPIKSKLKLTQMIENKQPIDIDKITDEEAEW